MRCTRRYKNVTIKKDLITKLENKTAKLGVVGLGYVGLPLAVEKLKLDLKL